MPKNKSELERFYSVSIPDEVFRISDETPADSESPSLFEAHLKHNHAYFGGLDKTLSGFVVLNSEGDDPILYDARDTGTVFRQDHEERCITPASSQPPASKRIVSTQDLARRYQWAVWFFAQPSDESEGGSFEDARLSFALQWFLDQVGPLSSAKEQFAREVSALSQDVHLAIFWLLCATAYADVDWAAEVVRSGPRGNELFRDFTQGLSKIGLSSELKVLPPFRRRRADFLFRLMHHQTSPADALELVKRSLVADPESDTAQKILYLNSYVQQEGSLEYLKELRSCFEANSFVSHALQAYHELHTGVNESRDARAIIEHLANPRFVPGIFELSIFADLSRLVPDSNFVYETGLKLLPVDPMHFSLIQTLARTGREIGATGAQEFEILFKKLSAIRPVYTKLASKSSTSSIEEGLKAADALSSDGRNFLSERILRTPEAFAHQALHWALIRSVTHAYPERGSDYFRSLIAIGLGGPQVLEEMSGETLRHNPMLAADLTQVLNLYLSKPEPEDPMKLIEEQSTIEALKGALAPNQVSSDDNSRR